MGKFTPEEEFTETSAPLLSQDAGQNGQPAGTWSPYLRNSCAFTPNHFLDVMMELIRNPNLNSSWLFRADILSDLEIGLADPPEDRGLARAMPAFQGYECKRVLVRKLIPRNALRDAPLDQTCMILESAPGQDTQNSLAIYIPHVSSPDEMPFYHPRVRGIAFLHEWSRTEAQGRVSVSFLLFDPSDRAEPKLTRTALQLLAVLCKLGGGRVSGYVKRVHHDTLIRQDIFQNTYAALKTKYAQVLIRDWAESTDPLKHVFEDLGIAAFLIELWADMYQGADFPGFVDIGCGNGLLVYILNQEGYSGWGFDARSRKSWPRYVTSLGPDQADQTSLQQRVLLPSMLAGERRGDLPEDQVHDGRFPKGTFIISNHADELTPWTPILATISDCPFVMIPCCSHDLTGSKFRAPPPKDKGKGKSAFASLVEWASNIALDCGWDVETEMLRIPSTRNTALVGRKRLGTLSSDVDPEEVVRKYGGAAGYFANAVKLIKASKDH